MALWFYTVGLTWLLLTAWFSDDAHIRGDLLIGTVLVTASYLCHLINGLSRPFTPHNKD